MGFDVTLTGAFLAGLLSFASPCILPLTPPFLCYMAGLSAADLAESDTTRRSLRILRPALAFVGGFTLVFVALGATASAMGKLLLEHLSLLGSLAGAVIIVMGLHFLGVLRIGLLYRSATVQIGSQPAGLFGAFVMGLAFAFGWTPCAGPVLAAVLFMAGAEESVGRGVVLLFAYAAGTGIPFLLAAAFAGRFFRLLGRFKRHLGTVEKVMGGFLVATGVLFITGSMADIAGWLLEFFPVLGRIG